MSKEKVYQFNEYILSYDKSLSDRSCLTISKIQNDEMYLMGELFDGSADVISLILDNLQQELTKYKERNETLLDIIRYYKTTEWGLKSCEILDNFEEILEDKENK